MTTAGTFAALDEIDNNFGNYYYNRAICWQVEHSEWVWRDCAENLQKLLLCSVRLRCPVPGPHSGRRWSKMDIVSQNVLIHNQSFLDWEHFQELCRLEGNDSWCKQLWSEFSSGFRREGEELFSIHETYPKGEEILTFSSTIAGESYTLGRGFPHWFHVFWEKPEINSRYY